MKLLMSNKTIYIAEWLRRKAKDALATAENVRVQHFEAVDLLYPDYSLETKNKILHIATDIYMEKYLEMSK